MYTKNTQDALSALDCSGDFLQCMEPSKIERSYQSFQDALHGVLDDGHVTQNDFSSILSAALFMFNSNNWSEVFANNTVAAGYIVSGLADEKERLRVLEQVADTIYGTIRLKKAG